MFPPDVLLAYVAAVLVVVVAPGPDNILAIGRGLSQGPLAAALSSVGAGIGIMVHTLAATLGLSLVLQASPWAFWVVKGVGAAYLLWLGIKALRSRDLITFSPALRRPLHRVFITGVLSNVLNPKPGLFVLAFIPQFVSTTRGGGGGADARLWRDLRGAHGTHLHRARRLRRAPVALDGAAPARRQRAQHRRRAGVCRLGPVDPAAQAARLSSRFRRRSASSPHPWPRWHR